ncbi:hypothetical protein ES703_78658 [subsurface metagenome]
MIKAVIIEPELRKMSITPYWRMDRYIEELYSTPVINKKYRKYWNEKIETIFLSYAAFWGDFQEILQFIKRHRESKLFWITNEYNIRLNSEIVKYIRSSGRKLHILANYPEPKSKRKLWSSFLQLNLNVLIFRSLTPLSLKQRHYSIVYYGMYRDGRAKYFRKYLNSDFIVSTSPKNIITFKQLGCKSRFCRPFLWSNKGSVFSLFRYSLYIEDEYTHKHYNYPANRFYEALSYGVIQLFDESCSFTFDKAGYDIAPFIVRNKRSLKLQISHMDKNYDHFLKQQLSWREKAAMEKTETVTQLKEIFQ